MYISAFAFFTRKLFSQVCFLVPKINENAKLSTYVENQIGSVGYIVNFFFVRNRTRQVNLDLSSSLEPKANRLCSLKSLKVKFMQRQGTAAIRTQIQTSKPKRKITKITNSQNTKRTHGQSYEQLFPKRWPLSNPNLTKII